MGDMDKDGVVCCGRFIYVRCAVFYFYRLDSMAVCIFDYGRNDCIDPAYSVGQGTDTERVLLAHRDINFLSYLVQSGMAGLAKGRSRMERHILPVKDVKKRP